MRIGSDLGIDFGFFVFEFVFPLVLVRVWQ